MQEPVRIALRPALITATAAALPVAGVSLLAWRGADLVAWAGTLAPYELALWIVAATVAFCGFALLPTHAVSLAAGWGLGAIWGMPVAWLSILLAVAVSYGLGGRLAGTGLVQLLRNGAGRQAVYDALVLASPGRTIALVALLRLSPLAPFAATNVALAGLGLTWRTMLLGSALGLAPRIVIVVLFGAGMAELDFTSPRAPLMLALGVIAVVVALVWTTRVGRAALRRSVETGA